MSRPGVRYITEEFIKISAQEGRLERVKRLNLDCGKDDKQIRYIEHLDNLLNLNVLSLRFHAIDKIEKLDKLANLKELYLSDNKINKLDGLENLLRLKILDLGKNHISSIPHWFTRRCKYLTKIDLSCNLFESVEEVSKLWTLKDLVDLDFSENPVVIVAHYRSCVIMRLKYLQILDKKDVLTDERKAAIAQFEENELDRLSNRLMENEKQLEQMKQSQQQLQIERAQQDHYQMDLHMKQKSSIEQIKHLEENLKSKDLLLKKKSEDLFRACQKYYELEQDIAFIKIDAKFDLLSNNIGTLEEPGELSDHSQISSTGDQAYMGKGQFVTKKEAEMLMERKRAKQKYLQNGQKPNENSNSGRQIKEDFIESLNDKVKEKLEELNQINQQIYEKTAVASKLQHELNHSDEVFGSSPLKIPSLNGLSKLPRPRSALSSLGRLSPLRALHSRPRQISDTDVIPLENGHANFTDQFLEKVENLTELQKEAEELRRQMESTEKESHRQQQDIAFLRNQIEKLKIADPNLAHHIENQVKEKELHVDENMELYNNLSQKLDKLSLAIENSLKDIEEIEAKLLEDNQYFTDDMRDKINSALSKLIESLPNKVHQDYKKVINSYRNVEAENQQLKHQMMEQKKEIDVLQGQIQNDTMSSSRRSARSIDDEVGILRQELNKLRHDALAAKDDLESEIEMEKVLNDELHKQIEELKQNEDRLIEELETVQENQRKTIAKVKADHRFAQGSAEQQIVNIQDDMLHRIKMATIDSNTVNLEKSENPIDKSLFHLIKSVRKSIAHHNGTSSPTIANIGHDLKKVKNELSDLNRKISFDSRCDPIDKLYNRDDNSDLKHRNSKTYPIKKMLSKSCQQYSNDMQNIKSKIQSLHDALTQDSKPSKKPIGFVKSSKTRKSYSKMNKDHSNDYTSSDDAHPIIKSRAHSHDRIGKKSKQIPSSIGKKWNSLQQGISSDEQAAFDAVQDELHDLMSHIEHAEKQNADRIKQALDHIADIEKQLQEKDEDILSKSKMEYLDREKENLAEHLRETMAQVERSQDDIRRLEERLCNKIWISRLEAGNYNYSTELEKMRIILQSQKAEIERLNQLLERLCIPVGTPTYIPFNQNPPVITPISSRTGFPPNHFLPHNQNSHSTPMLNNGLYYLNFDKQLKNSGSLFCNVPEHHYLEDYFQVNGVMKSSWKMRRKFKSDSQKYMNTIDTLQDDINRKTDELDNVEIQITKQTHEIERLNYQIDQLNRTKQDLLYHVDSLKQETEQVTRETIASTSESLGRMKARKAQLAEEIGRIELDIRDKKDEFLRAENELKGSRNYFEQVQEQTGETLRRYDEARLNHRKVILECEELEKRSKDAAFELAKAVNDLNVMQNEISSLSSNKMNLEEVLTQIQSVINLKDQEFQRLNEEVSRASQHLGSVRTNLNMSVEQNREKLQMLSEGDQLLSDTRLELSRLKNEIVLSQEQLEKLEAELGEKTASVEMINFELERSRQLHQKTIQENQNEQTRIKRDLSDFKFELETLKDERLELLNNIENFKMKSTQMKDNIDKQDQSLMIQQSELDKLNWQNQHVDNMLGIKQSQLDKILLNYQNKVNELEKIQEDIHEQQMESKKMDNDLKKRSSEMDKIRQTIALENENLQRLQFDNGNLESNISTLTKEKNLMQSEKNELEGNVKMLRRQEAQIHDSLTSLEGKVFQARTDMEKMHSEKCSETIKRDEVKMQSNSISKQLHESKCELQSVKERIMTIEAQCDERTSEIRKKMQLQTSLNSEIRKLQDQIRMANMSFEEVNNQEQQKRDKLFGLDADIARKSDEVRNLEKKIQDLQNRALKKDDQLEKILKTNTSELAQLKSDISEKIENLESTGNRLHQVKKEFAIKEFTEQKIFDLEEIIRQQETNMDRYDQENKKLANHVSVLSRDLSTLRQSHLFEMENKDREISKLKKRVSKDIFQLEKLAEEQCNRANSLSDDLHQSRRDYMLLRNRIIIFGRFLNEDSTCLAQEHFIEQQNLFKECMQPNYSKSSPSWETHSKLNGIDLPANIETAVLAEHRRHLQNQLNLLKENITSATHASQNGIAQHSFTNLTNDKPLDMKWNTGSSGLGSTLDHTGNSSDTFLENDRIQRALHSRFNEEVEKINSENTKCEQMCRQLRNEVNDLKANLPREKSPLTFSE